MALTRPSSGYLKATTRRNRCVTTRTPAWLDSLTSCNQNMAVIVLDTNNSYSIMPGVTKVFGRHTFKIGAAARRMEFNFAQTTTASGFYIFDNLMTSINPFSPGNTGFGLASFLAGLWIER